MPLSSSVMINRDEVLELLEEAIERLPEELRAARWLLKEREEFLAKTRARPTTSSTPPAPRPSGWCSAPRSCGPPSSAARQIVDEAEAEARRLRHEAEDYCDQKLGSFEIVLERTHEDGAGGPASRLQRATGLARSPTPTRPRPPPSDEAAFFDQDD